METEVNTNTGMQWRPDANVFVTPNQQNALFRICDISWKLLQTGQHGDGKRMIDVAWSPNGKWLVACSKSRICVCNVENQEIANFIAPGVYDRDYIVWSPDGEPVVGPNKMMASMCTTCRTRKTLS